MKRIFTIIAFLLISGSLHGSSRIENPIFTQLSVGEIPGQAWAPGISLGYHIDESWALTFTRHEAYEISRHDESWNAQQGGEGINASVEQVGARQAVEIRYSPSLWGVYFSIGYIDNGSDQEVIDYDRRFRTIGSSKYDTDMHLVLTRPAGESIGLGLGFHYLSTQKWSFNLGILIGIDPVPEYDISLQTSAIISNSDKKQFTDDLQEKLSGIIDNRYHQFNLGIGFAW